MAETRETNNKKNIYIYVNCPRERYKGSRKQIILRGERERETEIEIGKDRMTETRETNNQKKKNICKLPRREINGAVNRYYKRGKRKRRRDRDRKRKNGRDREAK